MRITRAYLAKLGIVADGTPKGKPSRPRGVTPRLSPGAGDGATSWTVAIPGWTPPSLNSLLRGHWARRSRVKRAAMDVVIGSCLAAGVPLATGRRRVAIVVTVANRSHLPDADNVSKAVLDALTHVGAIVDDGDEWCEQQTPRVLVGPAKGTTIVIEDIERRAT